jgi:hypothetical protein
MRRLFLPAGVLLTALGSFGAAATLQSGLQPGEKAGAYNALDCTGPYKGRKLCYR